MILKNSKVVETKGITMFNTVKRWVYYWKLSRQVKRNLKLQIEMVKSLGPAEPPTPEEVEKFKKEWDMGWNSHMIQRIEPRKRFFEASLN
jgi:hypothetical protein